jgi:WD40 repeat protein/DNA-binding SARP family transcriptional activator
VLFRLLGPLEVSDGTRALSFGEGRQRIVLIFLLLHRNEPITSDRLVDALWGEAPPPTAAKVLQNYVGRLRRALDDHEGRRLRTHGRAYALHLEDDELDVDRFERLVEAGGEALADDRPADAAVRLRDALSLWRGPALEDVTYETFAQPEIARLEELRMLALDRRIDADLALGRHADVVAELEVLIAGQPLREQLRRQQMLALYRCGRQAEALEAFREARRLLVDEVGVEPGAELRGLHEAILRQDPALELEPAEPLPRAFDPGVLPPIVGRDRELAWLRARWERARGREGAVVGVAGAPGIGKTRLAAGLAVDVHRAGCPVLYVAGTDPAEVIAAAVHRALDGRRPTLLVMDEADASDRALRALQDLAGEIGTRPVLVLAIARQRLESVGRHDDSLALGPVDADAVRRIASRYAQDGAVADVPVDELFDVSRGVPGRVHELASSWAQGEARRRVAAFAPRAAAGRRALRTTEAQLTEQLLDLQATRERRDRLAGREPAVVCPFKGLAAFEVADAPYFFGRERLVAELVAAAVGAPLLAVVGPSGSGKSSVVRAGLLPALAEGALPGSETWPQVLIRPGEHPLRELRIAGLDAAAHERAVLVVDQFEEVFTACRDERERAAFIDAVAEIPGRGGRDRLVVLAVRADFYGRCAAYPALTSLLRGNEVLVGPMHRDELRHAIERPAHRAGLHVEPDLVDALLADVEVEPGGLPLLSTALLELWRRRDGRELRRAAYEVTGGVAGAVGRLAEDAFGRLDPAQQLVARRVLLRLAAEGPGGTIVRRRIVLSELESLDDDDVGRVLQALTERRLLTMSATTVEVAHEALLREWPRLRGWLDEDAQGRHTQRRVTDAAREWDERGRDVGDLYRGARLAVALEWRAGHESELNATERAFLDAGRTAAGRAQRRARLAFAGVAALLAVAVLGGLVAVHQRSTAQTQARIAEAQRISVQALAEKDLDRALLLAGQGFALADSPITRGNLLSSLLRNPAAIAVIPGQRNPGAIDIGPDGRTLVVGDSRDGGAEFVDAVTQKRTRPADTGLNSIAALRFSPDGSRVAVAGYGRLGDPAVELLDAHSHRRLRRLDLVTFPSLLGDLGNIAFSPDSHVVAADFSARPDLPHAYRYLARWDARTGHLLAPPRQITSHPDRPPALAGFMAGGTRLATASAADGSIVIRDAATLRPLRRFHGDAGAADISADGRFAALMSPNGAGRLCDLRTGVSRALRAPSDARFSAMRFTPDSRRLVTAGRGGRLTVWDGRHATLIATVERHTGGARGLAISADGQTAYTANADGSVVGWDLVGTRRLERPFRGPRTATDLVAVTPKGPTFAVAGDGGSVDVFDSRTAAPARHLVTGPDVDADRAAMTIAVTGDGRTIAAGTADGAVRFVDVRGGRSLGPPRLAHVGAVLALAFSPDGRWLATSGKDSAVYVWSVARQTPVRLYTGLTGPATSLSISPEGTKLAATVVRPDGTGELDILSIPRLTVLARGPARRGTQTQFSHDGQRLFYSDDAGLVWMLDARTRRPVGRALGVQSSGGRFALTPDERVLATTSADGTTQLWDVPSRRPLGGALPGVAGPDVRTAFVEGGDKLVTLNDNGHGSVWDVHPPSWERRACSVAGRTLTRAEWHDALPERDYAPACRGH